MKTTAIILILILSDSNHNEIQVSKYDIEKQIEKQKQNDLQNEFYLNKLK